MKKAIILARVSTEEQMTEGHSIPAQLAKAREYASKRNFKIKSEYQFDESSIKDHRVKFEKVIDEIIKSNEPIALIVETVDRLQRSFKESVRLEEFRRNGKLEIHFIRENLIINQNSNSSELQRWDLAVFMAKSYVLQISDNVKRSITERLRQGIYPSGAPLGYLNDTKAKCLIVDPKLAPVVLKGFELYSTGQYSIRSICKWFADQGFRNRKGGTVYHSGIEKILKNPIYYGRFRYKGKLHDGKHTPIISKELFDKVQQVFNRKHHPRTPSLKTFPFKSILTCSRCNTHITAGLYKQKYVYYHCSFTKGRCGNPYVSQDKLIDIIGEQVIKPVTITEDNMKWIQESLIKTHGSSAEDKQTQIENVKIQINRLETRLDRLYEDKLDRKIPEEYWEKKDAEFRNMKADLECTLNSLQQGNPHYFEDALRIFELSQKLYSLYVKADLDKKAKIVNLVSSNCSLNDLSLCPTYRKPFNFIAEGLSCPEKLPREDSNLGHSGYT